MKLYKRKITTATDYEDAAVTTLTQEMVDHLNQTLEEYGVGFHFKLIDDFATLYINDVVDESGDGFVSNAIISVSIKFIDWLEQWFKTNYNAYIDFDENFLTVIDPYT